jgi:hypothetical protein
VNKGEGRYFQIQDREGCCTEREPPVFSRNPHDDNRQAMAIRGADGGDFGAMLECGGREDGVIVGGAFNAKTEKAPAFVPLTVLERSDRRDKLCG